MLFSLVRADKDVRYAAYQEKSGHSPFAPLKLRSLTVLFSAMGHPFQQLAEMILRSSVTSGSSLV